MTQRKDDNKASEQIDENLRRVFQEISDEELPKRLQNLLSELRQRDVSGGDGEKH